MRIALAVSAAVALLAALPAVAATPTVRGTVGPSFTISMPVKPKAAGKVMLVITDRGSQHNFHLRGPGGKEVAGVDAKTKKAVKRIATGVSTTGSRSFLVTLKKGTYSFVCDPHSDGMRGSFTIK
ncbi:MAG TPA: plastocyanin/azurin family copper-binding protein [Gaiella sp.]|jgi:hypothetical protein